MELHSLLVCLFEQYLWYRSEHIHPKFKIIIALLTVALVIADIAGFVYAIAYKLPKLPEWFAHSFTMHCFS